VRHQRALQEAGDIDEAMPSAGAAARSARCA
jgi:hypothetical protein